MIAAKGHEKAIMHLIDTGNKSYVPHISKRELRKILNGKKVGAQNKTVNLQVANYLEKKFGYEVRAGYKSYADVFDAVQKGDIDFGIVDSVRLETVSYSELDVLDIDLDPYLGDFYTDTLATDQEFYAIVVSKDVSKKEFINLLNELIDSKEGREERANLDRVHKHTYKGKKLTNIFDC